MPLAHRDILLAMTKPPKPQMAALGTDAAPPAQTAKSVSRGLARAIARAGEAFAGLDPDCEPPVFDWFTGLDRVEEALPEAGFLCLLDAENTQQKGIMALSQSFLDGLIEVQTTGRVDTVVGPVRRVTKIDTVLSRDFLDLLLGALSVELMPVTPAIWPARLHVGATMEDRNRVSLAMDEGDYHIWRVGVSLGGNVKQGELVFALPALHMPAQEASQGVGETVQGNWREAWHRVLGQVEIDLDAILYRRMIPLAQLEGLQAGDVLPVLPSGLDAIRLEDVSGRAALTGRLGQRAGMRAVRVAGSGLRKRDDAPRAMPDVPKAMAERADPQPPSAPPPPPMADIPSPEGAVAVSEAASP